MQTTQDQYTPEDKADICVELRQTLEAYQAEVELNDNLRLITFWGRKVGELCDTLEDLEQAA